jgi:hypothetical protein
METQKFESWAMIELFGHNRIAGLCSEINIGGGAMLRVDVPETSANPPFTRILNTSAIYAINPVTEEVARTYAEGIQSKPIESWDIKAFMKKVEEKRLLTTGNEQPEPAFPDFEEDEN